MSNFLEEVVERTRADVAARREVVPLEALQERLEPPPRGRPFSEALIQEGISLIAEMKRSMRESPQLNILGGVSQTPVQEDWTGGHRRGPR